LNDSIRGVNQNYRDYGTALAGDTALFFVYQRNVERGITPFTISKLIQKEDRLAFHAGPEVRWAVSDGINLFPSWAMVEEDKLMLAAPEVVLRGFAPLRSAWVV